MGFFDALKRLFSGSSSAEPEDPRPADPMADVSLDQLRTGYMVDYEMRTWEVVRHVQYDYDGWPADEWTLETGDERLYLEHEKDGGDVFYLSDPVDMAAVETDDGPLRAVLRDRAEPPATLTYNGTTYTLDAQGPATRIEGDQHNRLYYWTFVAGDDFLALERLGESNWNSYAGREVEAFEFNNILPRAST